MKKLLIIISILLIFPTVLFATDCAWLLWEYSVTQVPLPKEAGKWSLINALNSRNECLDALVKEYFHLYELVEGSPERKDNGIEEEVLPKLSEIKPIVYCLQWFYHASKSEPVSKECKDLIANMVVMENRDGVNSRSLIHKYKSKKLFFVSKYELWCLPAGVDPKTIGNEH